MGGTSCSSGKSALHGQKTQSGSNPLYPHGLLEVEEEGRVRSASAADSSDM